MAVRIRLKRIGKRKQSYFRVVVADQRVKRDGKVIDDLGYYQPWNKAKAVSIDRAKYEDWLRKGAVPTETVRGLFARTLKGGGTAVRTVPDEVASSVPTPAVTEKTDEDSATMEGEDRSDG